MRLSQEQYKIIKQTVLSFDKKAQIRLFGSRVNNNTTGGDIDLIILSNKLKLKDKLMIRSILKEKLGERKIDIILTKKPKTAFEKDAFKNSIQL
jgi:predicted nucleotidyltransferase